MITKTGEPSSEEKYYGGGIPEYGAYKITDVKQHNNELTSVTVRYAMPIYAGPGTETNLSEVRLWFVQEQCRLLWDDKAKAWKIAELTGGDGRAIDIDHSNQGYQFIRDWFGAGWAVPADSTQEAFAGAVKTR